MKKLIVFTFLCLSFLSFSQEVQDIEARIDSPTCVKARNILKLAQDFMNNNSFTCMASRGGEHTQGNSTQTNYFIEDSFINQDCSFSTQSHEINNPKYPMSNYQVDIDHYDIENDEYEPLQAQPNLVKIDEAQFKMEAKGKTTIKLFIGENKTDLNKIIIKEFKVIEDVTVKSADFLDPVITKGKVSQLKSTITCKRVLTQQ